MPDTNMPWPNETHAGLFIELKRTAFALVDKSAAQWATISTVLLKWLEQLRGARHHPVVCRGCQHAEQTIEAYCLDDVPRLAHLNQWWVDLDPALLKRLTKDKQKPKPAGRFRAPRRR